MNIDPDAFTKPPPRILIGPGERAEVYDALNWGAVERRGDQDHDPVQRMWNPRHGDAIAEQTEQYGFTLEQLEQTHDALEDVIDDPDFTERPTRECERAIALVEFAMKKLGYRFKDDGEPTGPKVVEADVLIPGRRHRKVVWTQCHCGSQVDLYDDGKLQCRDHQVGQKPVCLDAPADQLPWKRRAEVDGNFVELDEATRARYEKYWTNLGFGK